MVVVLGAGIIGSSIARELASRGARVTLLDPRPAGHGSTQAAAGMLAPYIEGFGKPLLGMARRSLEMYDAFVAAIAEESGQAVEYRRAGSLQVVAADELDECIDELNALHAAAAAAGVSSRLLDAHETRDLEPALSPDIVFGHLIPDHGFVVPTNLLAGVMAAAQRQGVEFRQALGASRVRANGRGIVVEAGGETIAADHVVLAAGCWSGRIQIDGAPALPVRPVRGQLLQVAAPPLESRRIIWGSSCYIVPSTRVMTSIGATVEEAGFEEKATVAGVHDLLEAAAALIPVMWQSGFLDSRVGLRPGTPDDMPIVGPSRRIPGLTYATGHFRNGILLAPLTARAVADYVLENRRDPMLDEASPQRFGEY